MALGDADADRARRSRRGARRPAAPRLAGPLARIAAVSSRSCSFVPRPLDFHPDAIPCPYPHSSVDIDEVIYYVSGAFSSRVGVGAGSLTLHPAGVPHGPHPGAYEASVGAQRTDELAVMLDTYAPLQATATAQAIEDPEYERSFVE